MSSSTSRCRECHCEDGARLKKHFCLADVLNYPEGPARLRLLGNTLCCCGPSIEVEYDGVTYDADAFLTDLTKPPGYHWIKETGARDRAVHYVLSQLLYHPDLDKGEVPYDMPDPEDTVTLLWEDHKAVGFYTIKHQGPCPSTLSTGIATIDTAFILPAHRGKGGGLALLQDMVSNHPGQDIAVSYPLSTNMWMVLKKFLEQNAVLRRKIWLVKGDCEDGNKTLIWYSLRKMGLLRS